MGSHKGQRKEQGLEVQLEAQAPASALTHVSVGLGLISLRDLGHTTGALLMGV